MAVGQDSFFPTVMAVIRGGKTDCTVKVHGVVPQDKFIDPCLCLVNGFKGLRRVTRTIFHGPEKGLGIRVIVTDTRPGKRCGDAQLIQGRHHGSALHRPAIVRMQNEPFGQYIMDKAGFGKQSGTVLHGFFGKDLGGDDFPAPDIHDHVKIIKDAPNGSV